MIPKRFVTTNGVYTFPDGLVQSFNGRFGGVVAHTNRLPGLSGAYDQHGIDPAPGELGSVRVSFGLVDESGAELDTQRDLIMAMAGWGRGMLFAQPTISGATERFCWSRVNNISVPERPSEFTEFHQIVTIDFQVSDPRWYVNKFSIARWGMGVTWGGGVSWGGTGVTVQSCTGTSTDLAAKTNTGNVPTLPTIKIEIPAGQTASNVTIKRIVGVSAIDQVTITGTLNAGDVVLINCAAASVTINGSDAYSRLEYTTPAWLELLPGTNVLTVAMDNAGDAADVTITYFDAYL